MGEAKRKNERLTPVQRAANEASHKFADDGLLIKAGFICFMAACFPDEQPSAIQCRELENAFMGGAVHLWSSIMVVMDPGDEATDRDMKRLDLIDKELKDFAKILEERVAVETKTAGSA